MLLDEAINLTSAFQLAGCPYVIGTVWEIKDRIAERIARAFYTMPRSGNGTVNVHHAAYPLHAAIRAICDRHPNSPTLWDAHLHAGA